MTKYYVNGNEVDVLEFNGELEDAVNDYVAENYDDILDDFYPEVEIGYCHFYASEILYRCDPVAYRCGLSDEQSAQLEDAKFELENYGRVTINDTEFIMDEIDEEAEEE